MSAEHIVADTASPELSNGINDSMFVLTKENIVWLLCRGIVTFQPIAFVAPFGRERQVVAQHDSLQ
jgi:hypothetical protein